MAFGFAPQAYAFPSETPSIDSITLDLVTMQQPSGGDRIAIHVYVNSCEYTAKADVYRSTSKKGTYTKIGTSGPDLSYYDTNITVGKTYYYYLLPIGNDGSKGKPCYGDEKQKVELFRPAFKVKSMNKNIVLKLPAYDFTEDMRYIEFADKVYGTALEIYRSSKMKGSLKKIATVPFGTQTYTDKTAKKGTPYVYRIKNIYKDPVTGKVYKSDFSEPGFARKGDTDNPTNKAVGLKATYKNGNIKITWKIPKGYKPNCLIYEYNSNSNSEYYTKDKNINLKEKATSYTIKNAKKNADYYILLCFSDNVKWKYGQYNVFYRSTDYYRIHINTGLNKNLIISDSLNKINYNAQTSRLTNTHKVSWVPIFGSKGYTIKLLDHNNNVITTKKVAKNKTSCEISYSRDISESSNLFYKIEFQATNGSKSQTLYSSKKMFLDYIYPKDISAKKTSSGVKISWPSQVAKGATSYRIFRYSFGGGYSGYTTDSVETGYLIGETTETSIIDTALKKSGTYYYVVVPCNMDYTSNYMPYLREYGKPFKY